MLQIANGDAAVSPHWDDAPEWQRDTMINGVLRALDGATPQELHESWHAEKLADGWTYGPVKDAVAKTHPCLVPYEDLPDAQRLKDYMFQAIVRAIVAPQPTCV
ncbi:RyR domain-containing protein [Microtetraspora malaysiensis]|uniref:RyR domain-containing protein n=1 Tax=Microtetraspora malaysiensis TaxID=161358 RepID=UPI003D8D724D